VVYKQKKIFFLVQGPSRKVKIKNQKKINAIPNGEGQKSSV
jgi:hypothetical protein